MAFRQEFWSGLSTGNVVGQVIVGYRISEYYGHEKLVHVFRAENEWTGQRKVLRVADSEETTNLVRSYAEHVSRLNHANIVRLENAGVDRGIPFMVWEYIQGATLGDVLESSPQLTLSNAVAVIREVLIALDHAHQCGLVHGDLRPDNILIQENGQIKVSHFYQVETLKRDAPTRFEEFLVAELKRKNNKKSASFMAPELEDGSNATTKSDIYSAGFVFYTMLTGRSKIVRAASSYNPDVSKELDDILFRMLEDESDRFASAAEVLEQLRQFDQFHADLSVSELGVDFNDERLQKEVNADSHHSDSGETSGEHQFVEER
jgi:serine/threonine-protein kinase